MTNLLDYSGWAVGTGSSTGYTAYGTNTTLENNRFHAPDPWNKSSIVWEITAQDDIGYAGGFYTDYISVPTDYRYRYSIYTNRLGAVGERTLFGCNAGTLIRVSDSVTTTNPYFQYFYNSGYLNEWLLLVGHINPYGYTIPSAYNSDGGVWRLDGTKVENADYEWAFTLSSDTSIRMRYFYYDSTDKWPTFVERCAYPRIEKCDGTELSMENLFRGPYPMLLGPTAGDLLVKVKNWH